MQMGLNNYSAEDVINKLDEKELDKISNFLERKKKVNLSLEILLKRGLKKKIDTQTLS